MPADLAARTAILSRTGRACSRPALLWGYVFGAIAASSALSYGRIYKTARERESLAVTFGSNHATTALFGPAPQLETVAGFTAFKSSMAIVLIGAIWGLLISTKVLRGEEEAGRAELLLSGQATLRSSLAQSMVGLASSAIVVWLVTGLIVAVVGRTSSVHFSVTASLYFALALSASVPLFMAVGAFMSQIAPTRRRAAGYSAVVLGVSYALRMVGDSGAGTHFLVWLSPIGWIEELRPLVGSQPWPLVLIAALTLACTAASLILGQRRDVGAGILDDTPSRRPRFRLLGGPLGLAIRLTRGSVAAWAAAIAATGLLTGTVAKSAGATMAGSSVQEVLGRLGSPGTGAAAFLGVAFLIVAVLTAFMSASQVTAAREEESSGRAVNLLSSSVSRQRWLSDRAGTAAAALFASGLIAGLAAWVGTATSGATIGLGTLVQAGVNVVPQGLFVLGIGVLSIGLWPRRSALVSYALITWSAVIDLVGGLFPQNHWLLDTSLFHQMASAPAVSPSWQVNGVMLAAGVAAALLGIAAFARRDLLGD